MIKSSADFFNVIIKTVRKQEGKEMCNTKISTAQLSKIKCKCPKMCMNLKLNIKCWRKYQRYLKTPPGMAQWHT